MHASRRPRRATRPRGQPAGGERQRRGDVGGPAQADVGPQRGRVAEHVQSRGAARSGTRWKCTPSSTGPLARRGMPRQHDVDLVAARGDALGDRLHEGADRVAREPRVRASSPSRRRGGASRGLLPRAAHAPAVPQTSRHGMIIDSSSTPLDSFDAPCRRSTKMIGTSPMRQPRRAASNSISTSERVAVRDDAARAAAAPAPRGASSGTRWCSRASSARSRRGCTGWRTC